MKLSTHHFKENDDVLKAHAKVVGLENDLDELLSQISKLKKNDVKPQDAIKRSALGAYVSGTIQLLGNYIDQNNLTLKKAIREDIKRIGYKADKVLRENIVLQTEGPIDKIPFSDVPRRYSYSYFGRRELRWGYGMHKKPFTENGFSMTLANMPPKYMQSIHNHTLSEYCLMLDSKTEGIYHPGRKKEKVMIAKKNQILHFSATTPHTLHNPSDKFSRNATFKKPTGLLDWRPASNLNKVKIVRTRIMSGSNEKKNHGIKYKIFAIDDRFYEYHLLLQFYPRDSSVKKKHKKDKYFFVVSGECILENSSKRVKCKKNDYIVIDKNTPYTLTTNSKTTLYTIRLPHHA